MHVGTSLSSITYQFQERFAPSIQHFKTVVSNAERIIKTANILNMACIVTEQYPKVCTHLSKGWFRLVPGRCRIAVVDCSNPEIGNSLYLCRNTADYCRLQQIRRIEWTSLLHVSEVASGYSLHPKISVQFEGQFITYILDIQLGKTILLICSNFSTRESLTQVGHSTISNHLWCRKYGKGVINFVHRPSFKPKQEESFFRRDLL